MSKYIYGLGALIFALTLLAVGLCASILSWVPTPQTHASTYRTISQKHKSQPTQKDLPNNTQVACTDLPSCDLTHLIQRLDTRTYATILSLSAREIKNILDARPHFGTNLPPNHPNSETPPACRQLGINDTTRDTFARSLPNRYCKALQHNAPLFELAQRAVRTQTFQGPQSIWKPYAESSTKRRQDGWRLTEFARALLDLTHIHWITQHNPDTLIHNWTTIILLAEEMKFAGNAHAFQQGITLQKDVARSMSVILRNPQTFQHNAQAAHLALYLSQQPDRVPQAIQAEYLSVYGMYFHTEDVPPKPATSLEHHDDYDVRRWDDLAWRAQVSSDFDERWNHLSEAVQHIPATYNTRVAWFRNLHSTPFPPRRFAEGTYDGNSRYLRSLDIAQRDTRAMFCTLAFGWAHRAHQTHPSLKNDVAHQCQDPQTPTPSLSIQTHDASLHARGSWTIHEEGRSILPVFEVAPPKTP